MLRAEVNTLHAVRSQACPKPAFRRRHFSAQFFGVCKDFGGGAFMHWLPSCPGRSQASAMTRAHLV
jgi:hypothetical protein